MLRRYDYFSRNVDFLEKLSPEESKRMNFWSLIAIIALGLLSIGYIILNGGSN